MIIQEEDFRLIPVDEHSLLFDLELLYTINPKGKESRQEFKNAGYGFTLENAIKKIAQYRINSKHINEVISLKTFLTELKEEFKSIKKLCNV